jgi:hypothetical protein
LPHSELNPPSPEVHAKDDAAPANASGCMVRVAWLASNVAVVIIAGLILREKPGPLSLLSAVYWGNVVLATRSTLGYSRRRRQPPPSSRAKPAPRRRRRGNLGRSFALGLRPSTSESHRRILRGCFEDYLFTRSAR